MNTTAKKATSLRLNRGLYERIEKMAKKEHRSVNNFIELILSRVIPNDETLKAIEDVEKGEVLKFASIDELFESV